MADTPVPDEVERLAEERVGARLERDWARADELKRRIETAGWQVVDDGATYSLHLASTPDQVEEGRTLYGSLDSVPSRLAEPATTDLTVVVIVQPEGPSPDPTLEAVAANPVPSAQIVVVAPGSVSVSGPHDELVPTVEPFTAGEALQAGLRRATGAVIAVLDPACRPTGDALTPLVAALGDPSVAVVGSAGVVSDDLRHFSAAHSGEVTTIAAGCYAFRREDLLVRGPVDGRLRLDHTVAAWVGLLLRDAGETTPPRRALVLELPLAPAPASSERREDSRTARRDGYRLADRFRGHAWLTGQLPPEGRRRGDGAEQADGDDDAPQADEAGQA